MCKGVNSANPNDSKGKQTTMPTDIDVLLLNGYELVNGANRISSSRGSRGSRGSSSRGSRGSSSRGSSTRSNRSSKGGNPSRNLKYKNKTKKGKKCRY